MIQQDWQRQDGIDLLRPETYAAAIGRQVEKTRRLLAQLQAEHGSPRLDELAQRLEPLAQQVESGEARSGGPVSEAAAAQTRNRPGQSAAGFRPAAVLQARAHVVQPPGHAVLRLAGAAGRRAVRARTSRAIRSAAATFWTGSLQTGNVLEPRLSYDGRRIVFSYVDCPERTAAVRPR